jgi:diguanylate cyclase (GGDEF)-like protein
MDHLINQYERNKNAFSLLFFDLDKFKQINDTHGHTFGDLVLKEVAARISKCIRKTDMVARLGGDEFVLLFENTYKKKDIEATIKHLTSDLARDMELEDKTLNINCSIGFAIFPNDGSTSDELLAHADAGMYSSKQRHRH